MRPRKPQAGGEIRVSLVLALHPGPRLDAIGVETEVNLACCAAGIATLGPAFGQIMV